jgi:HEAT repeat protein
VPKLVALHLDEPNTFHGTLNRALMQMERAVPPAADPPDGEEDRDPVVLALRRVDPDGKQAVPILQAALQKPNPRRHVVLNALMALGVYRERAAAAALPVINVFRSEDDDLRAAAFRALKELGDAAKATALPALIGMAPGKDPVAAKAAAGTLHALWPKDAEKADIPQTDPPGNAA